MAKKYERFRCCDCCGKEESYPNRRIRRVTCNCTQSFWEHNTERCVCEKCEKKLNKLMDKTYNGFFKAYNEYFEGKT